MATADKPVRRVLVVRKLAKQRSYSTEKAMFKFRVKIAIASAAAIGIALSIGGCPQTNINNGDTGGPPKLLPFESKSAWINYFRDEFQRSRSSSASDYRLFGGGMQTDALAGAAPSNAAEDSSSGSSSTSTNVQVAGVDEGDIFKSNGEHFFIARGRSIRIVDATPANAMSEVGRITLDDYISELYLLDDNQVIVLSQRFDLVPYPFSYAAIEIWPPYYGNAQTVVTRIDASNPANPALAQQVVLDGTRASSRVIDNRLILVLSISPNVSDVPVPLFGAPQIDVDEVMPKMRVGETTSDLVPWENWLYPATPNGVNMTAVVTLDAENIENTLASVAVLASAGTIYSSLDALYLTDTDYDVANNYREQTAIHKFAFDKDGVARYVASGAVSGRPLNQFSMDEHNDNLRIATYVQPQFFGGFGFAEDGVATSPPVATAQAAATPPQPSNAVYVLGESNAELVVKGSIENIAPGERLYSSRFMGDRGYLVTFQQIDPLFSLDLSNPAAPRIAGELKIPGFSDYLHPVGENHLLGVGRSTTTSPWGGTVTKALQLSLFDISDPSNPTVVQQIEVGGYGSMSEVSYDHHAFAYLAETSTLAIPATLYPAGYNPYDNNFDYSDYLPPTTTVLFYHVDTATGFSLLGQIPAVGDNSGYFYGGITRPAIIGDGAYAVNLNGVRSALFSNFSSTSTLVLQPSDDDYGPTYYEGDLRVDDGGSGVSVGSAEPSESADSPVVNGETVP